MNATRGNVVARGTGVLRKIMNGEGSMTEQNGRQIEQKSATPRERWQDVDAWGLALAGRQGVLDVELGEWLAAAQDEAVHRHLGYGTFAEYVERRVGLSPHATAERLRVADALTSLPATKQLVRAGGLSWSAARELTRVAVQDTERAWLEAAHGQRVHDIERLVSGRRPGQTPQDRADPRLVRRTLRFEVGAETYALWREASRVLQTEVDPRLSEEEMLQEVLRRALGGPQDDGRSPYQIVISRCDDCERVWQDAKGERVDLPPEVLERAECDAQQIGTVCASQVGREGKEQAAQGKRATQSIPPATRRLVVRRDGGKCRVPGCRNANWLDVHHLWLREEGGPHQSDNLAVLCGAHHRRLHAGLLLVRGDTAAEARFFHADGTPYGRSPDPTAVGVMSTIYSALRALGFRETESKDALQNVRSRVGLGASAEDVLRAALRLLTDGAAVEA